MGLALCQCLRGSTSKQSANANLKEKGKTLLCVIFTYTPPFIFQIPPELLVELDVSCVTILSSVLIICWSQGGLVGADMCSVGCNFVLSNRNGQMTYYTHQWWYGVPACGSII